MSGPVTIERCTDDELIPIQRAFRDACLEAGFPAMHDHNAIDGTGVGPWPLNRQGITRISTALAYLEPARPQCTWAGAWRSARSTALRAACNGAWS